MTQLQHFIQMLESSHMKNTGSNFPYGNQFSVEKNGDGETVVCVGSGEGYTGFVAEFIFGPDGTLFRHGVWE